MGWDAKLRSSDKSLAEQSLTPLVFFGVGTVSREMAYTSSLMNCRVDGSDTTAKAVDAKYD